MTTVEDMSTTRKPARYKGSRPRNQKKTCYADIGITGQLDTLAQRTPQ
jgi:hypothetical protein